MRVALLTTYRTSKKEPLVELLQRIHETFLASGLHDPIVHFSFSDAPAPGFTSAVERASKKFPKLEQFRCSRTMLPASSEVKQISNCPGSPPAGRELDLFTLFAILQGVPRSLPFHHVMVHFQHRDFGEALPGHALTPAQTPGIIATDSWWINGRNRGLLSLRVVDAGENSRTLPSPAGAVAAILASCGKAQQTNQVALPSLDTARTTMEAAQADPGTTRRVSELVRDYRMRLTEIVEQARMPHDLPSALDALKTIPLGTTSGPKKPALVAAFKPLGYSCRGGSGVFTLRRTSKANLSIEVALDVGSWSNSLTAFYEIHGVGFTARLPLPPCRNAIGAAQYQIGDAARWNSIVANLAALVTELDRTFLPDIESASGGAPAWFHAREH